MSEVWGTVVRIMASLLAVAAVIGVAYIGFSKNKTQKEMQDLAMLSTSIQALYNGQNNFTSLNNTVAIDSSSAPTDMISGSTLTNPWGGTVTVAVNSGNASEFDITTTNVPRSSCAKLVTSMSSIVGLMLNGTTESLPMDAGTAATSCAATNTIALTYGY